MRDKLTDCIRVGKVSAIYPERCTAEVTFDDRGNVVTRELPVLVPFTLKDRAYYMPAVQERVICLFDPGAPSVGYIVGSYYCDTRIPPYKDENKTYINFEDETHVEYDKKLHTLTVTIPESGGMSINIETASNINVLCKKDVNITVKGEMRVLSEGDMYLESKTLMHLDAPYIRENDKYPG
jgi:phage baseplate assembly protein V